jgi:hypothetical protein
MSYCLYFQAHVKKEKIWFLTSILRSCEHLVFDRTLDQVQSIFEFFVPEGSLAEFQSLMKHFEKEKVISQVKKLPNRFINKSLHIEL